MAESEPTSQARPATPGAPAGPAEPPAALVAALTRLLKPLIHLMLSFNITYPTVMNLLKGVYVRVAETEFPIPGRRQSDSRISVLTGVHRKDVRRLRNMPESGQAVPANVSLGAQLVALWTGLAEYQDADGQPRPLARHARAGGIRSFEGLVEHLTKDVRPRVILDEWLRLGVARLDEDNMVWLNTAAFVPSKGFEEKAYYFGRNLHDHIAAGTHNLKGDGAPLLERSVYYDQLTPESIEQLKTLAEAQGMAALHVLNREALALAARDEGKAGARHRMNFGVYFYHAPDAPAEPDQDTEAPDDQS